MPRKPPFEYELPEPENGEYYRLDELAAVTEHLHAQEIRARRARTVPSKATPTRRRRTPTAPVVPPSPAPRMLSRGLVVGLALTLVALSTAVVMCHAALN